MPEPSDRILFVGGDVLRRSVPVANNPGADEYRPSSASCVQPTQVRHRACRYLHAEFLVHLPRERAQF